MTIEIEATPTRLDGAIIEMIDRVQPGVVQVRSEGRGIGAGVIWRSDGQIITNHHVVTGDNQPRKVEVLLTDGREFPASVVALNPTLDLALLQIAATGLPAIQASTASQRVGELVFAVGHPWGVRGVVTAGIISGLGEVNVPGSRSGRKARYIRSDVRLQPGNSGGPLLNAEGAVVGINAMIFGGDLGVAIPGTAVSEWLAGLTNQPRVSLGAGLRPTRLRIYNGGGQPTEATGLKVVSVQAGGRAEAGGLQAGDIVLEIGGERVRDVSSLADRLTNATPDTKLSLSVLRGDAILPLEIRLGSK